MATLGRALTSPMWHPWATAQANRNACGAGPAMQSGAAFPAGPNLATCTFWALIQLTIMSIRPGGILRGSIRV